MARARPNSPTISGVPSFARVISIAHWQAAKMPFPTSVQEKFRRRLRALRGGPAGAATAPAPSEIPRFPALMTALVARGSGDQPSLDLGKK